MNLKLPHRRHFLRLAAGAAALPAVPRIASALDYPTRPVRIVIGFPAGISPDVLARLLAQSLTERLGQSFVVENRPGAGSNIGAEIVAKAAPDGYTLLAATATNTVNETLYTNLNFDFLRDTVPVAGFTRNPSVVAVTPSFPAKTVPELIAYAKANPGKVTFASGGIGTVSHIPVELFKMMAGIDLVHVPYRGNYFPDVLSGQVQLVFAPTAGVMGYIQAGKLRALAVTSATRLDALPGVPTLGEFVPDYETNTWGGLCAPRNTPTVIIDMLNKAVGAILADPSIKARLADLSVEPMLMSPAEFGKLITDDTEKWAKVIKFANIRPE
jgi:tripartite-type tricarboxylate transporter receptor subunit TctC